MGVINTLPTQIGFGVSGFSSTTSSPFDVKVGDLEFMLAVGPDNPLIRRGAEYRTQQVNFSGDPGETALGFWWQREQSTWHYGAGNPTFDGPGAGDATIASGRFYDSYGVDVWEEGEISLLHDTVKILSGTELVGPVVGVDPADPASGVQYVYWADGDEVRQWDEAGGVVSVSGTWGDIYSIACDGVNLYFTDGDQGASGGVMAFKSSGFAALYTTGFDAGATRYLLRWAKQRLMFVEDNRIYELDPNAASSALPTELFEHPNPDWIWTDIVEGPGAIYASGYVGSTSAIYKFVLDTAGALPTLTAGIVACELPDGEQALSMKTYIGLFMGVGTSSGLRVCSFSDTDIALAPLTVELGPVRGITAWDRFLYATCDDAGEGGAGVVRVDLSVETAAGRYAWARDVRANGEPTLTGLTHTNIEGEVLGIAMYSLEGYGATPVFAVDARGIYARHFVRLTEYGQLTSGRILFGMTDKKHFVRMAMSGEGEGSVTLYTGVNSADATLSQSTLDFSQLNEVDILATGLVGSTLTLAVALTREEVDPLLGVNAATGPTVSSYSAKALPAQSRERQWILPLRVYDRVEGRSGNTVHQIARDVIDSLEDLVRTQQPVRMQTFFGDPDRDWVSVLVHVEDCEYRQVSAEPKQAWGGILTVSLRTISG